MVLPCVYLAYCTINLLCTAIFDWLKANMSLLVDGQLIALPLSEMITLPAGKRTV